RPQVIVRFAGVSAISGSSEPAGVSAVHKALASAVHNRIKLVNSCFPTLSLRLNPQEVQYRMRTGSNSSLMFPVEGNHGIFQEVFRISLLTWHRASGCRILRLWC